MRISRLRRLCTRLYKTSMLRRLVHKQDVLRRFHFQCPLLHRISSYRTFRASNLTRRVSFCCRSFDTFCANFCLFWFKLKSLFEVFNSSLTAEAIRLTVVLCPSRVVFILDRLFPFGGVTTSTFRQLIREGSTAPASKQDLSDSRITTPQNELQCTLQPQELSLQEMYGSK